MPTNLTIQDHHVIQFTSNITLLLQQKQPRLAGATTSANYTGEGAQAVLQLGSVEMEPIMPGVGAGQWKGDTVWSDIEHRQRWIFPSDFAVSLPLTRQDQIRMIADPRSPYAEAVRAAYARKYDDIIIAAALGRAKVGRFDDLMDQDLPAGQIISDGAGLSIEKLIDAKEMLISAHNDPGEERFFACSEKQLSELLKNTKVQSADYNTVKALVKGEVDSFVGFRFISTERLPKDGDNRQCLAWVKSALHVGLWDSLTVKSDERPDKNYVWQLYARATLGATRVDEQKLIQVDCKEA